MRGVEHLPTGAPFADVAFDAQRAVLVELELDPADHGLRRRMDEMSAHSSITQFTSLAMLAVMFQTTSELEIGITRPRGNVHTIPTPMVAAPFHRRINISGTVGDVPPTTGSRSSRTPDRPDHPLGTTR